MHVIRMAMAAVGVVLAGFVTDVYGEHPEPEDIFRNVRAAYADMDVYRAEGSSKMNMEMEGMNMEMETTFFMLLQKPNRYRIEWQQGGPAAFPGGMQMSGAVWSDGTQPYLYMGMMNTYAKMNGDEVALGGATGISYGAAFTIPSLLLEAFAKQPDSFTRIRSASVDGVEAIDGDECYVVGGESTISKRETFWVSTSSWLIRKYERSLEPPPDGVEFPEMSDEDLEAALRGMGREVNEENVAQFRAMTENAQRMMSDMGLRGTMTEYHRHITHPDVKPEDFVFTPPEGAERKDALFDGAWDAF